MNKRDRQRAELGELRKIRNSYAEVLKQNKQLREDVALEKSKGNILYLTLIAVIEEHTQLNTVDKSDPAARSQETVAIISAMAQQVADEYAKQAEAAKGEKKQ